MVVLRHSRYSVLVLLVTLSIDFNSCHTLQYFQNIGLEQMFVLQQKGSVTKVSTKEQLLAIIDRLTDNEMVFVLEFLKRILNLD